MENLFIVIRQMIGDCRRIYLHTEFPQWKITQLKSKLFWTANEQSKEICEWWYRLYEGNYSVKDLKVLKMALEKDIDITEQLTQ